MFLLVLGSIIAWILFFYAVDAVKSITTPTLFYRQIGDSFMADSLTYTISAGPVVDVDVVSRVLTVTVGGEEPSERSFPGSSVDFGLLTVPQDSTVVLTLVDVDDSGNKSVPAVVEFVAADTLPPTQPGGLGVTLVGENVVTPVEPTDNVDAG
jgi:hypothetical protein